MWIPLRTFELTAFMALSVLASSASAACAEPRPELGMDGVGRPTARWLAAVHDRLSPEELDRIRTHESPLTRAEQSWAQLAIGESLSACRIFDTVNSAFAGVAPPKHVRILLGNQAGDDAFTAAPDTIALDLAVFAKAYGTSTGKEALMRRILAHEYSHLLLTPYLERIGWSEQWAGQDPYLRAVRALFNEGIANLWSIDDPRWVNADGTLTSFAIDTVAALEPVLLDRLQRLEANPSPDEAERLLRNISQGPFTAKWGAVPIAVWLQSETGGSPLLLSDWIRRGPGDILALAVRNVAPRNRSALERLLNAVAEHANRNGRRADAVAPVQQAAGCSK